ncbi:HAD family hydrolase [Sphingobacterium psychroaquaticum]|uniref:Putative hydrolase of the HAD superfamily n=1 Tax=Sphingobacterium psychroaquaticum TaxID=561061 RepID=A0A1X7JPB0_9SPHI|nr:HAD family hydrolase [Sphingobacterium psychroaquaticum]SMG29795.1 putative hydrolase of the HAD superfamily [Sphingobacterium psychroaquaticum]
MDKIETIAFDADDTLWINENYFQEAEKQFCELLDTYLPAYQVSALLLKTEIKNLPLYGYGVKGFVLCMIETSHAITGPYTDKNIVSRIIEIGHSLLQQPVVLLDGVLETLKALQGRYNLIVATKGDLLDQQRKLRNSSLEEYFSHVEIMSDKTTNDYRKLLTQQKCLPQHFLMLGNSLKSDVLPVLELGGFAAHIPYEITWAHEEHTEINNKHNFLKINKIENILNHLL